MKTILLITTLFLSFSLATNAQDFTTKGNSIQITERTFRAEDYLKHQKDSLTTYTYTKANKAYQVYRKREAFYIIKTSKTGKAYRYYLPKEIQQAMGRVYKD